MLIEANTINSCHYFFTATNTKAPTFTFVLIFDMIVDVTSRDITGSTTALQAPPQKSSSLTQIWHTSHKWQLSACAYARSQTRPPASSKSQVSRQVWKVTKKQFYTCVRHSSSIENLVLYSTLTEWPERLYSMRKVVITTVITIHMYSLLRTDNQSVSFVFLYRATKHGFYLYIMDYLSILLNIFHPIIQK